jgi:putative membrane protein
MLYVKAFHIISMVAWFAGLFYLPRLFVYHADSFDQISIVRFKIMQRRLYYGITWPSGIMTTFLGLWLVSFSWQYYLSQGWMHAKFILILAIWAYHLKCGKYVKKFAADKNTRKSKYFRLFNEIPTIYLICTVLLVVVKPF